jgi:hypothetical protein
MSDPEQPAKQENGDSQSLSAEKAQLASILTNFNFGKKTSHVICTNIDKKIRK